MVRLISLAPAGVDETEDTEDTSVVDELQQGLEDLEEDIEATRDLMGTVGEIGDKIGEVGDKIGEVGDKVGDIIGSDGIQDTVGDIVGDLSGTVSQVGGKLEQGIGHLEQRFNIAPGIIPVVLTVLAVVLFLRPLQWILKLVLNSVLGLVGLVLLAQFGPQIGVVTELSIQNIIICGAFGIPGVAVLFLIEWLSLL